MCLFSHKGLSIKEVREGGFVQCGHFSDKGRGFRCERSYFYAKNLRFFEFYGVSARKGDKQGEMSANFLRFLQMSFINVS